MPGFITHYIAGQALLDAVQPKIRRIIEPRANIFNLGAQGPDIFFYYVPGFIRRRSRGVGSQMHMENLGVFFMHMANRLKNTRHPAEQKIVFAYTSGFLMHYSLDVYAHPYVYACTHNDNDRKLQSAARHRQFETALDVEMLKLVSGEKPADYKLWHLIRAKDVHMRAAALAVSSAVLNTYNRDVQPLDVYMAMRYMVRFTRLLQSKGGRRKRLMALAEDLTIRANPLSAMVHMQEVIDGRDYMNIKKASWNAPWEHESREVSFVELYQNAVAEAAQMVQGLYSYMRGDVSLEKLMEQIGNRSLKTGEALQWPTQTLL